MLSSVRHALRLVHVARTLARHDALFTLEFLKDAPPTLLLARRLAAISVPLWARGGDRTARQLRPGQKLARALESLGPSFIKLGQSLATRPDLIGEQIAEDLTELQDNLPPFSGAKARRIIERELGKPVDELFASFDDVAIAAASIAQVHFAVTADGREVAVKVLRPDIEKALTRDFDMFRWLARLVERAAPLSRRLRPMDAVNTLAHSVELEMDLRYEAAAASELAENMQSDPNYEIPEIDWRRTSARVLTLGRIDGTSFGDLAALDIAFQTSGTDRKGLAAHLVTAFLMQALYHGFFHADLHQGNLFMGRHGQLIAIDFGIMGRLDHKTRRTLAEILYGFVTRDYYRLARAHFDAGYVPSDQSIDEFAQALRAIGEPIAGRPISEISLGRLLAQLLETTATFSMQAQPQLLLLQKTMVMVEGVAYHIDAQVNMWEISRPVIEGWMQENLGFETQARETVINVTETLRRLPVIIEHTEETLKSLVNDGIRLHPDTLKAHGQYRAGETGAGYIWAGLAGGIIGALLVSMLLG